MSRHVVCVVDNMFIVTGYSHPQLTSLNMVNKKITNVSVNIQIFCLHIMYICEMLWCLIIQYLIKAFKLGFIQYI